MSPSRPLCAAGGPFPGRRSLLPHHHDLKVLARQLDCRQGRQKGHYLPVVGRSLADHDLIDAESIARYDLLSPAGDAAPLKKADLGLQTNVVELKNAGVHQVVVVRKPGTNTFVLDAEGKRHSSGPKTAVKGSKIDHAIRSLQSGKALIVVGAAMKEPVKPAGLSFEIVPLDAPEAGGRQGSSLPRAAERQGGLRG